MDVAMLAESLKSSSLRPPTKERLRSYAPDILGEILKEADSLRRGEHLAEDAEFAPSPSRSDGGSPLKRTQTMLPNSKDPSIADRAAAQRAAKEAKLREKDEQFRKSVERRMMEATSKQDAEFASMYRDVLEGLSNSSGIMGETQFALNHSAKIKGKKKDELYQEWNTEVFDKIQTRLQTAVGQVDDRALETRLRKQMDDYITTSNTKLGVFRDVIIEQDYNPFTAREATIRIPTSDIMDPLKRDMLKPYQERQLMGQSAPATPLGKATLETTRWGDLQIHATPYGHCMDTSGNYIVRPVSSSLVEVRKSRVPFDHYDFPTDPRAAQVEMGRIGKSMVPGPEVLRGRKDLFDVMQNTVGNRPEFTGGDIWLEAKGKGMAPGPEQRRGRKGLHEIIQQTSNPYKEQPMRTLDDIWLEARGKANPPGPGQRRGRKDLGEIIQQTSNPYKDGRTLGDAFLEQKGKGRMNGPPSTIQPCLNSYSNPPDPQPYNPHGALRVKSHLQNDLTLTVRKDVPHPKRLY